MDLRNINLLGTTTSCIENLDEFLGLYFKGQTQERDIKENVECIKNVAAKIFEYSEEGSRQKGFSRKEVFTVLKTVFPKKEDEFLKDNVEILFLAKRLFIGGKQDGFSRIERLRFNEALVKLESEMIKSRDSIKYLFYDRKGVVDENRDKSFKSLRESFDRIDEIRTEFGGEINEAELLGIVDQIFRENSKIYKFKKIVVLGKDYLFGTGKPFKVGQKELFSRVFSALEMQARLRLVDFSNGFLVGKTFYDLQKALNLITGKMRLWSNKEKTYTLNVSKVKDLVTYLHEVGVMNKMFSDPEVVNETLGTFLTTIFKTEDFNYKSFDQFNRRIQDWISRQNRIISKYKFSWAEGRLDVLSESSIEILESIDNFKKPQFTASLGEPMKIKRGGEDLLPEAEYFDLSLKHGLYSLVESFYRAYTPDGVVEKDSMGRKSLDFENIKRIFDDIRPLAVEMGFADPHSCDAVERSFVEADALTINGNGDRLLSIEESAEWMATMISTGSIASHILNQAAESCALPGMQVLGHQFVSRGCLKKNFYDKSTTYSSYFSTVQPYLDMLSSPGRVKDFNNKLDGWGLWTVDSTTSATYSDLMSSAFNSCGMEDFPVSKRELGVSIAVTIYVENMFYQYDKTGVKNHFWNDDPEGADLIIDGPELSKFLKEKLEGHADRFFEPYRNADSEDKHWYQVSTDFWYDSVAKPLAGNMPELLKIDRVGIYKIIKKLLEGSAQKSDNQFRKNYCNDVYASFETSVFYKKEEKLMCTEK